MNDFLLEPLRHFVIYGNQLYTHYGNLIGNLTKEEIDYLIIHYSSTYIIES